jgi:hypothetical protein
MAFETGTASDYRDLLQKLKLFLTNQSSPESGLNYELLEERSQNTSPQTEIAANDADALEETASEHNQSHDQMIFRGTGGTSPETSWYFAIQTSGFSTSGYYNWQIRGLTGFTQNSPITDYVGLVNQPGLSPPAFVPLQNTTMTYWFQATDRRVIGVIKTGTSYHSFYVGYINVYGNEADYPYPLAVCGSADRHDVAFGANAQNLCNPMFGHGGGSDSSTTTPGAGVAFPTQKSNGWLRYIDGAWHQVRNFWTTSTGENQQNSGDIFNTFPYGNPITTPISELEYPNEMSFQNDLKSTSAGGAVSANMASSLGSPETFPLWPVTIYYPANFQIIGDFDGVNHIYGTGSITSEDTIVDTGESPEVTYYIFQNTYRTDPWMFGAIRGD